MPLREVWKDLWAFGTRSRLSTTYLRDRRSHTVGTLSSQKVLARFDIFNDPVLTICETETQYLAVSAQGSVAILTKDAMLER